MACAPASTRSPARVLPGATNSIRSSPAWSAPSAPTDKPARSAIGSSARSFRSSRTSTSLSSRIRRSMKAKFANSPPAISSTPSATRSSSAAPSPIHNAHLAMLLKVQGQCWLIFRLRPRRCAPSSPVGRADDLGASKIGRLDNPRRTFAGLVCRKGAFANQTTDGRGTDREHLSRFVQRRFAALDSFALAIDGDVMFVAQGNNPRTRPRIALSRRLSHAVQGGGNRHVRHLPSHGPHQLNNIGVDAPAMLSRTVLAHTQSCVIVASPADDQIQAVVLHPHDDLLDQHANNTFARGYGRPLRMPSALDVGAEPEQRLAFAWAYAIRGHHAEGIELFLEPSLLFQALVPTPLQFSGNQSVVGIDGVILPSGVRRFETRLLDRPFDLPPLLGVFAPARPQSRQRRLDAQRLNTLDHLRGNRTVDTKTAEGDAALHAVVDQGSSAVIARDVTFGPAVGDVQLASAVAATEQPG